MQKAYEDSIKDICNIDDWRVSPRHEKEGAVGVACMLGYMNGVKPEITNMAYHLNLSEAEVERPMKRLLGNGIFSPRKNFREDPIMLGRGEDRQINENFTFNSSHRMRWSWCWVAGVASGLCGLREDRN